MTTAANNSTNMNTAEGPVSVTPAREYAPLGMAAILLAMAVFCTYFTITMDVIGDDVPGPQVFPAIVATLLFISSAGLTWKTLRLGAAQKVEQELEPVADDDIRTDWKTLAIVVAAFVGFLFILYPLGWILSATALFWTIGFALGTRNHLLSAAVGLIFASTIQIAFSIGLGLNLPSGVIGAVFSWIS